MQTYKILSRLLSYPEEKRGDLDKYEAIFRLEGRFEDDFKAFAKWYDAEDLYTLQETYVATFDLSRRISLNLYDYVYGEDPRRGEAMAALIGQYAEAGFVLLNEMPDYLPALLEFASEAPEEAAKILPAFAEAANTLKEKLEAQQSPYADLIKAAAALMTANVVNTGGV